MVNTNDVDRAAVDTPPGMVPAVERAQVTGIPAIGTGLSGAVYVTGSKIQSIDALREIVAAVDPVLRFSATEIAYEGEDSETTVAEFLGPDAASLDGDGSAVEMGPSGLLLTGYIYIPEGVHEIAVVSDDGFALEIGGVAFSSFEGTRGAEETARTARFEGGLYEIELLCFDAGGRQELALEIDGAAVDDSALHASVEDFLNPPTGVETVPPDVYDPTFVPEVAVPLSAIEAVPVAGTGLAGAVYAPGMPIDRLSDLEEILASGAAPDLTFTASRVAYGGNDSETSVAGFLGADAASLSGDGTAVEMGPSGLVLEGYVYIPAGLHEIAVTSDDGFSLEIGGAPFMDFEGRRPPEPTVREAAFEGGLYEIRLTYFDASGKMSLFMEIDGFVVDASAFYAVPEDLTDPPAGTASIPAAEYHPSLVLPALYDGPDGIAGTPARDAVDGLGGDDTLAGGAGDDDLAGNYGDDKLEGGAGHDRLDGGRGSDFLLGGAGDDLLVSRSDAGVQRIGQLAVGDPTRPDPDGEVDPDRQKLAAFLDQPLLGDDILMGGEGRDTFLIAPQINGKRDVIERHVHPDGSIDWAGVAGENDELHDHWIDSFGVDRILDYAAGEDLIAVIGHTAVIAEIAYRDTDGDGRQESVVTVLSDQGSGGGAHDRDLLGQLIVHGDRLEADDIVTDAGVTWGIVEGCADLYEALEPAGASKISDVGGESVPGYDTRDASGGLGPVTGRPEDFAENPYASDPDYAVAGPTEPGPELTRTPFEPLGTVGIAGETRTGGAASERIAPEAPPAPSGVPAPLAFWQLGDEAEGAYPEAAGGPAARAWTLFENQAILRTDGAIEGPGGRPALAFDGEEDFAFIDHDPAWQVTQGTVAVRVRPDNLSQDAVFLSKDQKNSGDGGHFRLGHTEGGGLLLRMAPGDGGSNRAWVTAPGLLGEGAWAHVAVSFTATGVNVYLDGQAVDDALWTPVEGDVASPGVYREAYLLANAEPWVLGADTRRTEVNDTAAAFAADDERLDNAFAGALADLGIWGGYVEGAALDAGQVAELAASGPGTAAFSGVAYAGPLGPGALRAGADTFSGGGGDDTLSGEAGDDALAGEAGADSLLGGYGDDCLEGGPGPDTLDGGRGSDLLLGGDGDDLLISRSDAGEQRAGQLVLGAPSRPFPDPSIDPGYLKLVDWLDQPLVADDVLAGGAGADHFLIEPLINARRDIVLEHVEEDRTIDWAGVAGENARIHDHWVDLVGIEVIADYDADEDRVSVIGHTAKVSVDYAARDEDGDGLPDRTVSIVTIHSEQGKNGGAHDEDILGYIAVFGDPLDEDAIETDPGVTPGIVETVDELQEAMAPTGETRVSAGPDGGALFGYDSRDVPGDPIGTDPFAYSSNPFLAAGQVAFPDPLPEGLPAPGLVLENAGGAYDGAGAYDTIAHAPGLAQRTGTWSLAFTADSPGEGDQAILSKDHRGNKDGGHLTVAIGDGGKLEVRFQDDTDQSRFLHSDEAIEQGRTYHLAFTFDEERVRLYLDGELVDEEPGFAEGMLGNVEETLVGASARRREGEDDNTEWFFDGTVGGIAVLDRPLEPVEAILLAAAGGDTDAIGAMPAPEPRPEPEPENGLSAYLDVFLADSGTDAVIADLSETQEIGASLLEGRETVVFAEAVPDAPAFESVRILSEAGTQVENVAPFAQFGDRSGDLQGDAGFDVGPHEVTFEVWSGDGASGTLLETVTVSFSVVEDGPAEEPPLNPVTGTEEGEFLLGTPRDDLIEGLGGRDILFGAAGDDLLAGGPGRDLLVGGPGADRFLFEDSGAAATDRVLDFDPDEDVILLDAAAFAALSGGGIARAFALGTEPAGEAPALFFDTGTATLSYDPDGAGGAAARAVVRLPEGTMLDADGVLLG